MTSARSTLDDAVVERLLTGRTVDGRPELGPMTAFVGALGGLQGDPPAPRGRLAELLAGGFDPAEAPAVADDVPVWAPPAPGRRRLLQRPARLAGLSLAAKVLLGGGVAAAGVTSAAGAGVLPAPVQNGVRAVVEAVTPFQVPRAPATGTDADQDRPAGPPETGRPSAPVGPVGPPSPLPAAPAEPPGAPERTARPEQAEPGQAKVPEQPGRPTDAPGRTARPEQAPSAPPRTRPDPPRAADPEPPGRETPGPAREQAPGRQQAPGQSQARPPASQEPAEPAPANRDDRPPSRPAAPQG